MNLLFWLEWLAVWAFAATWLVKGRVMGADLAIDLMAMTQDRLMRRDGVESTEIYNGPDRENH